MPRTSKRVGLETPGARRLNQVVARNMKDRRLLAELSQAELAERVSLLGHAWTGSTVGDIETRDRNVTVDELGALALALEALVPELLDPAGVTGAGDGALDPGAGETGDDGELAPGHALGPRLARAWVWGRVRFALIGTDPLRWRPAAAVADERVDRAAIELAASGALLPKADDDKGGR